MTGDKQHVLLVMLEVLNRHIGMVAVQPYKEVSMFQVLHEIRGVVIDTLDKLEVE